MGKVIRYIAYSIVGVASVLGALVLSDVIPKQRFQSLPQWLRVLLFVCVVISCAATVYGFIDDYRQIRRARRP